MTRADLRIVHRGTRATQVAIGVRKAPAPQGLPGYIRIDTVHQGDQDGVKGPYHINAVNIITQWQIVASVQRIGKSYLLPVIAKTSPNDKIMTPWDRLRRIQDLHLHLKPGITSLASLTWQPVSPAHKRLLNCKRLVHSYFSPLTVVPNLPPNAPTLSVSSLDWKILAVCRYACC